MDEVKKYNRHSIRDISINRASKRTAKPIMQKKPTKQSRVKPVENFKRPGNTKVLLFSVAFLFLAIALAFWILRDNSVTVEISNSTAKAVYLSDDLVHIAYMEPQDGQLGYKIKQITKEASQIAQAQDKKYVEQKAVGTLIVYNDYSTSPQRIINRTRFKSPEGKIYRVRKPFVIPGKKIVNGKSVPGSVEVKVYAEEPGSDYNMQKGVKMVLPGLQDDKERFKKIYAESKTRITGGFKGEKFALTDEEKKAVENNLKEKLEASIMQNYAKELQDNEISFKDLLFIDYQTEEKNLEDKPGSVQITVKANIQIVVFDKFEFAKELIASSDSTLLYDDYKVYILNPELIDFTLLNKEDIDPQYDDIIKFTVKGSVVFNYYLDEEEFKKEVAGKDINTIMGLLLDKYPALKNAGIRKQRLFVNKFPEDINKIKIKYKDVSN